MDSNMQWLDKVFGVSPQVLSVRSQRFEMIAANLANADTPGYKAIDKDFSSALAAASDTAGGLTTTSDRHIAMDGAGFKDVVQYRTPMQPSMDGNTVEVDVERSAFMDNSIRYQASLNFLDARIKGILGALRGE
jgi:flagellar basal-body rod protein FlgB